MGIKINKIFIIAIGIKRRGRYYNKELDDINFKLEETD